MYKRQQYTHTVTRATVAMVNIAMVTVAMVTVKQPCRITLALQLHTTEYTHTVTRATVAMVTVTEATVAMVNIATVMVAMVTVKQPRRTSFVLELTQRRYRRRVNSSFAETKESNLSLKPKVWSDT